jgi:hypothetical protein
LIDGLTGSVTEQGKQCTEQHCRTFVDVFYSTCDSICVPVEMKYPHVQKEPGEPARLERQPRTRVSMIVRDHVECGLSPDEIVRQYPYLKHAEVYAALAYYFDHAEEIGREIEDENRLLDEASRQRQPPVAERLHLLKKRSGCP